MDRIYSAESAVDLCGTIISDADGELMVFNPSRDLLSGFVTALFETESNEPVSVLTTGEIADTVTNEFLLASRAQDLIDRNLLRIDIMAAEQASTFLTAGEAVYIPVLLDSMFGITVDDAKTSSEFRNYFTSLDSTAEPLTIRTPSYGRILSTFEDEFGAAAASNFEQALQAAAEQPDPVNPTAVALLIGAMHELLLYDISHWGEDIGLASKATFSRTKTRLEERDLIDTEKVPIEVGRPRLRLQTGSIFGGGEVNPTKLIESFG